MIAFQPFFVLIPFFFPIFNPEQIWALSKRVTNSIKLIFAFRWVKIDFPKSIYVFRWNSISNIIYQSIVIIKDGAGIAVCSLVAILVQLNETYTVWSYRLCLQKKNNKIIFVFVNKDIVYIVNHCDVDEIRTKHLNLNTHFANKKRHYSSL